MLGVPPSFLRPDDIVGWQATPEMGPMSNATVPGYLGPQLNPVQMINFPSGYPTMTATSDVSTDAGNAGPNGGVYSGPYADRRLFGEPLAVWLGFIGLLILLKWFSERPDTLGGANPSHFRIGGYNLVAVGLSATVFIILLKLIFNRIKLPGFTEFANAI